MVYVPQYTTSHIALMLWTASILDLDLCPFCLMNPKVWGRRANTFVVYLLLYWRILCNLSGQFYILPTQDSLKSPTILPYNRVGQF